MTWFKPCYGTLSTDLLVELRGLGYEPSSYGILHALRCPDSSWRCMQEQAEARHAAASRMQVARSRTRDLHSCTNTARLAQRGEKQEAVATKAQTRMQKSLFYLVAEGIHFALFGIILPTIKLKVYTFWGLMNSATKFRTTAILQSSSLGKNGIWPKVFWLADWAFRNFVRSGLRVWGFLG